MTWGTKKGEGTSVSCGAEVSGMAGIPAPFPCGRVWPGMFQILPPMTQISCLVFAMYFVGIYDLVHFPPHLSDECLLWVSYWGRQDCHGLHKRHKALHRNPSEKWEMRLSLAPVGTMGKQGYVTGRNEGSWLWMIWIKQIGRLSVGTVSMRRVGKDTINVPMVEKTSSQVEFALPDVCIK